MADRTNGGRIVSLSYMKRTKLRISRRTVIILALATVGALALAYRVPSLARQARYLADQRQLLRHSLPHEMIVYEHQNGSIESLLQDSRYTRARNTGVAMLASKEGSVFYYPTILHRLVPSNDVDGVAYIHERNAPGHSRRLVVTWIDSVERMGDFEEYIIFHTAAYQPASWRSDSRVSKLGRRHNAISYRFLHTDRLRVYAGQSDPLDASRFTIRYAMRGEEGLIDGELKASDIVTLTVRDGPLWELVGSDERSPVKGQSVTVP